MHDLLCFVLVKVTNKGSVYNTSISNDPLALDSIGGWKYPLSNTGSYSNYENNVNNGVTYQINSLRNLNSNTLMFEKNNGYIHNSTPLNDIDTITLSYKSDGSTSASHIIFIDDNPITTNSQTVTSSSTFNSSSLSSPNALSTNIVNQKYFRIAVTGNKNLQLSKIDITFKNNSASFTPSQQASAYIDYFMELTGVECATASVSLNTWNKLVIEYENLINEAKTDLISNDKYEQLIARYIIIVEKYQYQDFLSIAPISNRLSINNQIINQSGFLVIISLALVSLVGLFSFNIIKKKIKSDYK